MQGNHDVEQEVFLSVPAILNNNGVTNIIKQPLNEVEHQALLKSASLMGEVQANLNF